MAHIAELGLLAGAFAEQPCVRIGGRGMRVVLAPLAVEVALGVAATTLILAWGPSFGTKLFISVL